MLKLRATMKREEFLHHKARDEALTTAVWKCAKQALGHECQHDKCKAYETFAGKTKCRCHYQGGCLPRRWLFWIRGPGYHIKVDYGEYGE
jgi:hypothetical protein